MTATAEQQEPIDVSDEKLDSIRKKIAAAFELGAQATTEHEAMQATLTVQRLCDKYNLEIDDVLRKARENDSKSLSAEFVSRQIGEVWATRSIIQQYLHNIVIDLYNVRVYYTRVPNAIGTGLLQKSIVVGFEFNVEAAKATFDYLENEIERFVAIAKKEGKIKGNKQVASYRLGMASRLFWMAKEYRKTADESSLALVHVTSTAFEEFFANKGIGKGKKARITVSDRESFMKGHADGNKVNLTGSQMIEASSPQ